MTEYDKKQYKLMNLYLNIYNKIKNGEYELNEMNEIIDKLKGHSDADFSNDDE